MFAPAFGGVGRLIAVAVTALVAFTLGAYSFYGFRFLAHWQVSLLGSSLSFLLLSAAWGTAIQYFIWSRSTGALVALKSLDRTGDGIEFWAGAYLALLLCLWWLARDAYYCALIATPIIGLFVFGIIVLCESLMVSRLRAADRDRVGFAALLAVEAMLMFSIGEILAVDSFRKGLAHFEKDNAVLWSITTSGKGRFVVDYATKDFVLTTPSEAGGEPFELRRSFANHICTAGQLDRM